MRFSHAALAIVTLAAAPLAGHAQTTITFAANACTGGDGGNSGSGANLYAGPFDVQGFRFTSSAGDVFPAFVTPCSGARGYAGAPTLSNNSGGATTMLRQISGTPFSIGSIALAPLGPSVTSSQVVTFIGTLVGGGTVTQSFTVSGAGGAPPTLANYTFLPTFTGLTSLEFSPQGSSGAYQFTDLEFRALGGPSVVPEPGTWALLGAGLAGLGGVAARRRRSSIA